MQMKVHTADWLVGKQGSVEERIMEMVRQRQEGTQGQDPSSSRGLTLADLRRASGSDRNQVPRALVAQAC